MYYDEGKKEGGAPGRHRSRPEKNAWHGVKRGRGSDEGLYLGGNGYSIVSGNPTRGYQKIVVSNTRRRERQSARAPSGGADCHSEKRRLSFLAKIKRSGGETGGLATARKEEALGPTKKKNSLRCLKKRVCRESNRPERSRDHGGKKHPAVNLIALAFKCKCRGETHAGVALSSSSREKDAPNLC